MITNTLFHGDSSVTLKRVARESVDLIVTSPPYDSLRSYGGVGDSWNFDKFKTLATELVRVLKEGGVLVWNVKDQCVNGGYSCSSYRQVLYFVDVLGLRLHDTIVWQKSKFLPKKRGKRYQDAHELMYVFSKGTPKTFNPIMRECKLGGKGYKRTYKSFMKNGRSEFKKGVTNSETVESNVWMIPTANANETNYTLKDSRTIHHTAVFPKELAARHIKTWTNEGNVVLDPFLGSGTTGVAAVELGRSFIGCEMNDDYFQMASERIEARMTELGYTASTEAKESVYAPIYAQHELGDKDILTKRYRVNMWVKDKKQTLYVQRVSSSVYDRFGFSQYHYIEKPINKGAACFLFTDRKNRPIAFVGLLNQTFKGCHNGIMVSRFVILPKFQKRGLSVPILESVGAMLSASGYQLYFNTQNELLGEAVGRRKSFVGTTYDKEYRDGRYDKTHRNRIWGKAWRKKYVGRKLFGYSELFKKVAVLRSKSVGSENDKQKVCNNRNRKVKSVTVSMPQIVCNSRKTAHISPSDAVSASGSIVTKVAVSGANTSHCMPLVIHVANTFFNTS